MHQKGREAELIKPSLPARFSMLDLTDNTYARFLEWLISNILQKASRYLEQGIIIEWGLDQVYGPNYVAL